ncbi:MAG TPA: hypothetical protein VD840_06815 [Sinorhizobium sp.]|nr:hypothetical protein [Sinorhizobium sp.]
MKTRWSAWHRVALREPKVEAAFGVDSMPEAADNVGEDFGVSLGEQVTFAACSQTRKAGALEADLFAEMRFPIALPQEKADPDLVDRDEYPRLTIEQLACQGTAIILERV